MEAESLRSTRPSGEPNGGGRIDWESFYANYRKPGYIPGSNPPTLWHEKRAAYKAALAEAVKPHKRVAKEAFTDCMEYGIIYQYFDGELRTCEQWLSKNYPREYHMIDEFHGAPERINSGLDERPQALKVNGKPVVARRKVAKPKKSARKR